MVPQLFSSEVRHFLEWLDERGFRGVEFLSKGTTSLVFRALLRNRKVVVKLARPDSPRRNFSREAEIIRTIEHFKITPPLIEYGTFEGLDYIVRGFAEGREILRARLKRWHFFEIALKTATLDRLGLDHGQMQGGKHIIVGKTIWIIDFEKANWRKPNNLTSAMSMIFVGKNAISEKIYEDFGLDEGFREEMREALREYKRTGRLSPVLDVLSRL
ncbi:serine/threonine protein kinase [Thermococcus sp.]|uniref:serine/threonine protein kinase n=1 Tax=Thermococcus sp. TaxID=35749 RepID=UPI00263A1A12|nr:serine/threonine protein kinase [Thermococcus sp.]